MIKIQKIFLALFVLFVAVIPVWRFLVVPGLEKMPKDYNFEIKMTGLNRLFDIESGQWLETIPSVIWRDSVAGVSGNILTIDSIFRVTNAITGDLLYGIPEIYAVDRTTRENVAGGDQVRTGLFLFPLHIEKKTYNVWFPTLRNGEAKFESVEKIKNLETYKFTHYISPFDKTEFFPWVKDYVIQGDEGGSLWVEPTSGTIVKIDYGGINKMLDPSTLKEIQDFQIWSQNFTDDTIANQVRLAQNEKQKIILYEHWIPILFGLIALAFLIALFASRKMALNTKP